MYAYNTPIIHLAQCMYAYLPLVSFTAHTFAAGKMHMAAAEVWAGNETIPL